MLGRVGETLLSPRRLVETQRYAEQRPLWRCGLQQEHWDMPLVSNSAKIDV